MATPRITVQIGADTSRLNRDLKKGQTTIQKFGSAAMRSFDTLALAAGTAAIAIGKEGVEAAIADQAAQVKLAKTLQNTTKATDAQVAATEDYIDKTQRATGVADDELRPSLDRLVRSTRNVEKAQELQALALDVSVGSGKDLSTVTEAIARAYDGNFSSLKRLGIPLDENIIKTKDFDAAQKSLATTFEGQAAAAAETTAGKMERLKIAIGEAEESIGYALLPTLEELTDYISSPEGQAFIEDFAKVMSEAFRAAAEQLPGILNGIKQIGKIASGLNIDFGAIADPRLLAAAAAFRVTPGPIQIKAIAALAAYTAAQSESDLAPSMARANASTQQMMNATKLYAATEGIDYGSHFAGTWSGAVQAGRYAYATQGITQSAYNPAQGMNRVSISVNAVDPVATARVINKIVNGGNGNGSSNKVGTRVR